MANRQSQYRGWVAASSAAWGWHSGVTIPKSFGFEAATHRESTSDTRQAICDRLGGN
ncbi:MAG: hypothetical protein ACE5NM_00690 [Sedimentisphaerales bacterium]